MVCGTDHWQMTEPDDMVSLRIVSLSQRVAHPQEVCQRFYIGTASGFLESDNTRLLLANEAGNKGKPLFPSCKNIVTEET